jgi:hypothetical protein
MLQLEHINGFRSPGELKRFMEFLEAGIKSGELEEVPADAAYHAGEIYGGRWFRLTGDGSVWRLVPPDPPFTGLFERVHVAK